MLNFLHFGGLFLTSVCMSYHQINEFKHGVNLQDGRVKMVLNVLEKYANFWESNTENQATTESKTKQEISVK